MCIRYSLMILVLITQIMGCSTQAWKHALQDASRQECYQLSAEERERCLQRIAQQVAP